MGNAVRSAVLRAAELFTETMITAAVAEATDSFLLKPYKHQGDSFHIR